MLKRLRFEFMYFFSPPWDTGISPPELMEFIANSPPGQALDLGCGTGTNVITLAQHGWRTTGIDFSWKAIWAARKKARQAGVKAKFHVGDVIRLEKFQGPFNLVLDIGCYHNLSSEGQAKYRANLERLLATGGVYLLYTFVRPDEQAGKGLSPREVSDLGATLVLDSRQDGSDRGSRTSAWFRFHHR
jgi:SAM-dependent methyltransferase